MSSVPVRLKLVDHFPHLTAGFLGCQYNIVDVKMYNAARGSCHITHWNKCNLIAHEFPSKNKACHFNCYRAVAVHSDLENKNCSGVLCGENILSKYSNLITGCLLFCTFDIA